MKFYRRLNHNQRMAFRNALLLIAILTALCTTTLACIHHELEHIPDPAWLILALPLGLLATVVFNALNPEQDQD